MPELELLKGTRDYLPQTRLNDLVTGEVLAAPPGREELVAFRHVRTVALDLISMPPETAPTVYGRVRREPVPFPTGDGEQRVELTFLTYSVPFARSGLPAGLGRLQRIGVTLAEWLLRWDREDWHELDVYVAYTLVLGPNQRPLAVMLAQHNHHRTYLIGQDLAWPENDRLRLDVAVSSNELYLSSNHPEPVRHRTIPFPNELDFLLSGENRPLTNGYDVTHGPNAGGGEVSYALGFLAPSDPFYTFQGRLGAYRPFLGFYVGRSGSPGADYYTLPRMLPYGNTLKFAYLQDGDAQDIAAVREHIEGWDMDLDALIDYGGRTLWADWQALGDCGCGQ